jgi:hypothetical protein
MADTRLRRDDGDDDAEEEGGSMMVGRFAMAKFMMGTMMIQKRYRAYLIDGWENTTYIRIRPNLSAVVA